jgi:hypothetical protein
MQDFFDQRGRNGGQVNLTKVTLMRNDMRNKGAD